MVFRKAKPQETAAVFEMVKKRVDWMNATGIRQWNVTGYLDAYPLAYYEEQQSAGRLYVLEMDKCLIGAVVLLESDERWVDKVDSPALYVHNLVSDGGSKGGGRIILSETEKLAMQNGKKFVRLDCAKDNEFLNHYYAALGYEMAGTCTDGPYIGNRREKQL